MAEIVANCPRCGAKKTTFDIYGSNPRGTGVAEWQRIYEAFCVCRHCYRATLFILKTTDFGVHAVFAKNGLTAVK